MSKEQLRAEREAMQRESGDARARIAQLERLADEDSLAPIANRHAFGRELSRMMPFTRRYDLPSSLIYIGVTGLKQINDTHGRPAGDAALRHILKILSKNIRQGDIFGRLGGDEFGVLLAQTNQERANAKGMPLAQAIGSAALGVSPRFRSAPLTVFIRSPAATTHRSRSRPQTRRCTSRNARATGGLAALLTR